MSERTARAAGILLPVASLSSSYGIGALGAAAYRWVDFLHAAGQRYWQVLPLGPTGFGDSPYQSVSAFAGNPYVIDLDLLCNDGLLTRTECVETLWGEWDDRVDYKTIFENRERLLRRAFSRFSGAQTEPLENFRCAHSHWLEEYALYLAIKTEMGLRPWWEWDEELRLREPAALERRREQLRGDIDYHVFVQYLFYHQWVALKEYANGRGVRIIGDLPIYVAMDSADVWADSGLFLLDENRRPIEVAGVPPDGFSPDGQLWGNPLYRWDVMQTDGYAWWMRRLGASLALYDRLRIDHFRGFESYFAVPWGATTAQNGVWRNGPGMDFIGAVGARFAADRIIAEDLGYLTDEVRELLRASGYPGMKVLQFAFDSREESDYMPHNYDRHCVVYTGTHDNDTVRGWFSSAPRPDVALARRYLGIRDDSDSAPAFIRAALGSVANLAIIPIQDYLGLGGAARINIPSTVGGNNWRWRVLERDLTPQLAGEIAALTRLYGRGG